MSGLTKDDIKTIAITSAVAAAASAVASTAISLLIDRLTRKDEVLLVESPPVAPPPLQTAGFGYYLPLGGPPQRVRRLQTRRVRLRR